MTNKFELTSIEGNLLKENLVCVLEHERNWYTARHKKLDQYGVGKTISEAVKMLEFNIMSFYFNLRGMKKYYLNENCKEKLRFLEDLFIERPEKPKENAVLSEMPQILLWSDAVNKICPFKTEPHSIGLCTARDCMMWVSVGNDKGRCGLVNASFAVGM